MSLLKEYNPKKVTITWLGINIDGIADGTFVESARNEDNTTIVVGAAGHVGITMNPDKTGTTTVTLLQQSVTNLVLSRIQLLQDVGGELVRGPLSVVDNSSGSMLLASGSAFIQTPSGMNAGKEQENRSWVFFCEDLTYTDGSALGQALTPAVTAILNKAEGDAQDQIARLSSLLNKQR